MIRMFTAVTVAVVTVAVGRVEFVERRHKIK